MHLKSFLNKIVHGKTIGDLLKGQKWTEKKTCMDHGIFFKLIATVVSKVK